MATAFSVQNCALHAYIINLSIINYDMMNLEKLVVYIQWHPSNSMTTEMFHNNNDGDGKVPL